MKNCTMKKKASSWFQSPQLGDCKVCIKFEEVDDVKHTRVFFFKSGKMCKPYVTMYSELICFFTEGRAE